MTTFYHVSLAGIEVERAQKDLYSKEVDTFTDLRLAKRCFATISAAEIARLRALRKRIAAARTREDLAAAGRGQ